MLRKKVAVALLQTWLVETSKRPVETAVASETDSEEADDQDVLSESRYVYV